MFNRDWLDLKTTCQLRKGAAEPCGHATSDWQVMVKAPAMPGSRGCSWLEAGAGALGDMGAHVIGLARFPINLNAKDIVIHNNNVTC